jgi:copper chaperone CopZ
MVIFIYYINLIFILGCSNAVERELSNVEAVDGTGTSNK